MRLLHIDDERAYRTLMRTELTRMGHAVVDVGTTAETLAALKEADFDVALLDLRLGDENGLDTLQAILEHEPHPEVIMLTGHGTIDSAIQAMRLGAYHFLMKPVELQELEVTLAKTQEHLRLTRENTALRTLVTRETGQNPLVGSSRPMRELIATAEAVAPTDAPILIQGESGTGKELLADLIHCKSLRADKPFIAVNCAAFQEQLLASELFGHERGAFTGATAKKLGLFEAADGGTLFLDEIGDMTPAVQATLLRALESGEIRPLGSTRSKKVDVRIISATNKSLRDPDVHFREDLYFRLNTVELHALPLREHLDDLPELVESILARRRNPGDCLRVDPQVYPILRQYDWPGNVRELRNVIERAAILCKGTTLYPSDIADLNRDHATPTGQAYTVPVPASLAEVHRMHIERVLAHFEGNKTLAAKALGVTRKTLYTKLSEYGAMPGV